MAALSITAANVNEGTGAVIVTRRAGGTLTAGLALYADSADNFDVKAAGNATAAAASIVGIALTGSSDGQKVLIQTDGTIDGMNATEGEVYVLGTSGGIVPFSDLTGDEYVTVIGVGDASGGIILCIKATGVQKQGA